MGNSVPAPAAAPLPDRRGWVIAFGVIEILIACLCLLMAALVALSFLRVQSMGPIPGQASPARLVIGAGFYTVCAVFFVVGGIGTLLLKNWARVLMLAGSGIWLLIGVVVGLFGLLVLPRTLERLPDMPPGAEHLVVVILAAMEVFFGILLPLVFLFFYTRKSVQATFVDAGGRVVASAPGLPLPVILLGAWEAIGIVTVFFTLRVPGMILFGAIIRGGAAVSVMLAHSVASVTAAWLIFKRRVAGWNIAAGKALFWAASAAVILAEGNINQKFLEVADTPHRRYLVQVFPSFYHNIFMGTGAFLAVYIVFVLYTRKFFLSPRPAQPADALPS